MQADVSVLRKRIIDLARTSVVGGRVKDVILETDQDDDGSEFLRVTLEVLPLDDVQDDELVALIESIESAVGEVDERFPSVRFADAA
jgi:hypothetical protein